MYFFLMKILKNKKINISKNKKTNISILSCCVDDRDYTGILYTKMAAVYKFLTNIIKSKQ